MRTYTETAMVSRNLVSGRDLTPSLDELDADISKGEVWVVDRMP